MKHKWEQPPYLLHFSFLLSPLFLFGCETGRACLALGLACSCVWWTGGACVCLVLLVPACLAPYVVLLLLQACKLRVRPTWEERRLRPRGWDCEDDERRRTDLRLSLTRRRRRRRGRLLQSRSRARERVDSSRWLYDLTTIEENVAAKID